MSNDYLANTSNTKYKYIKIGKNQYIYSGLVKNTWSSGGKIATWSEFEEFSLPFWNVWKIDVWVKTKKHWRCIWIHFLIHCNIWNISMFNFVENEQFNIKQNNIKTTNVKMPYFRFFLDVIIWLNSTTVFTHSTSFFCKRL